MRVNFYWRYLLVATAMVSVGCSDDKGSKDPEPSTEARPIEKAADCGWLEQTQCWKQTLKQVSACRDPQRASGHFTSNQDTCTLGDGTLVRFQQSPRTPEAGQDRLADFDVSLEKSGRPCAQVRVTSGIVTLTAGTSVVSYESSDTGLRVTCGKEILKIPDTVLQSCSAFHIPTLRERITDQVFEVTLDGAGEPQAPLLSCVR